MFIICLTVINIFQVQDIVKKNTICNLSEVKM